MNALTPQRKLKHDKGGRYSRLDHRRSIGAATKMTGEVAGEVAVPWRGVEVAETNKVREALLTLAISQRLSLLCKLIRLIS
ncbi:hypothetical protein YC2023_053256 [Brassica napus]